MGTVVTVGNYKGGVGKTKNAVMIAYELALLNKKVLLIDLDPQGNATFVLTRTKQNLLNKTFVIDKTLMSAIVQEDLKTAKVEIMKNLDLIPSYIDFSNYEPFLNQKFGILNSTDENYKNLQIAKMNYLSSLIDPLKSEYDYIIIDVPPTKSLITDSAVACSSFVLLVLQTQELSLNGAVLYINDLKDLILNFGVNVEILGVLPVLLENNSTVDRLILELAKEKFGSENIFNTVVPHMRRLKRFDNTGITDSDHHDRAVHELYTEIAKEFEERIKELI